MTHPMKITLIICLTALLVAFMACQTYWAVESSKLRHLEQLEGLLDRPSLTIRPDTGAEKEHL